MDRQWSFWIDRGGTFTDVIGRASDGEEVSLKLLSASPAYEDAAVEAMRRVLGAAPGEPFPAARVEAIKMGTTVATNALLERRGAKTLFVTTEGFADALVIGVPFHPDGAEHDNTKRARKFGRQLNGRFGLPVHEVDERYTTVDAESAGARDADSAAAALILEQYFREHA